MSAPRLQQRVSGEVSARASPALARLLRTARGPRRGIQGAGCAVAPNRCHRRRRRLQAAPLPPAAPPLEQLVQSALQDLLSVAGLEHEDSWEAAAPAPLPQPPQVQARPSAHSQAPITGGRTSARRASAQLGAFSTASASSELEAVYAQEEALPCAGAACDEEEAGLPPAAALRFYQARLRAAQADLAGMQAATKAKEAKLGSLEKEVQQLRWGPGVGHVPHGRGLTSAPHLCLLTSQTPLASRRLSQSSKARLPVTAGRKRQRGSSGHWRRSRSAASAQRTRRGRGQRSRRARRSRLPRSDGSASRRGAWRRGRPGCLQRQRAARVDLHAWLDLTLRVHRAEQGTGCNLVPMGRSRLPCLAGGRPKQT